MKQLEESVVTLHRVLRMVTFRQTLILALLCAIILITYITLAITKGIGPQFLVDIYQPVKFVGFVDDCPEMLLTLNGQRVRLIYQSYRKHSDTLKAHYVIAAYTREADWTADIKRKICEEIDVDAKSIR